MLHYGEKSATCIWINNCGEWYDAEHVSIDPEKLPEHYVCENCLMFGFPLYLTLIF